MPIDDSPILQKRLLDLFPATTLRETPYADDARIKADAVDQMVEAIGLDELYGFVSSNFGVLHQHVHLFEWTGGAFDPGLPFEVAPVASREREGERHLYYLLERSYHIVLDSPLEYSELEFSWPVKLVVAPDHVRAHLTIMAKNPTAYIPDGRGLIKATPYPTEQDLVRGLQLATGMAGHLRPMDLNRGIKALWAADEYDAPVVQYKRPVATSRDVMDEDFTVKRNDPNLYTTLQDKPLFTTTFSFTEEDPCIPYFVSNPTEGTVTFRRYSASSDCVDRVIRKILQAN